MGRSDTEVLQVQSQAEQDFIYTQAAEKDNRE